MRPLEQSQQNVAMSALPTLACRAADVRSDEGFSMRATARDFDAGLTLARVDKPLKEEAVGC